MNYHNITYPDMNNGSGLRVVLWCSACSHHCVGCQNPQTWDANSGIPFDEKAEEELFRELSKDYISGLTLTGGDPLHENNLDDILRIVNKIRLLLPEKNIWLYTGYTVKEIYTDRFILSPSASDIASSEPDYIVVEESLKDKKRSDIIKQCDVLVDGRYIDKLRDVSLHWCGSSNQRVIDIKQTLNKGEVVLWAT